MTDNAAAGSDQERDFNQRKGWDLLCGEPRGDGEFRVAPLNLDCQNLFLELVATEIGARYPETGLPYAEKIWAAHVGGAALDFGTTSQKKIILGLYRRRRLEAFTVATEKLGLRVKFGPTIVLPNFRGLGRARLLRDAAESSYRARGFLLAYSTCQASNAPAAAYVGALGYLLVARLRGHYEPGVTELVFAKALRPQPARWFELLQGPATRKTGGLVSLSISTNAQTFGASSPEEVILEHAERLCDFRKLSLVTQQEVFVVAARRLGFEVESTPEALLSPSLGVRLAHFA